MRSRPDLNAISEVFGRLRRKAVAAGENRAEAFARLFDSRHMNAQEA
jgi:hypothetical protein